MMSNSPLRPLNPACKNESVRWQKQLAWSCSVGDDWPCWSLEVFTWNFTSYSASCDCKELQITTHIVILWKSPWTPSQSIFTTCISLVSVCFWCRALAWHHRLKAGTTALPCSPVMGRSVHLGRRVLFKSRCLGCAPLRDAHTHKA